MNRPNILVLTYWSWADALIQTYTLPYLHFIRNAKPGSKIYLLTLEKPQLALAENEKKITRDKLKAAGIIWLSLPYRRFGFAPLIIWGVGLFRLAFLIFQKRIGTLHCWATPAGAAGYFLSVLTSSTLIIDSYEPHAESMVENGTWTEHSIAFRLLFWLEKKQTQRAAHIISATEGMRGYAREKYGTEIKSFYVKPACVDLNLFSEKNVKDPILLKSLKLEDKIVCVYAGKLGGIYLDREVFDFLKIAADHWGDKFRFLLLSNQPKQSVEFFCKQSGFNQDQVILNFVPHALVPSYMGLADFAITPVKPVATKRYCTPIKDGEYWALGLPVIIPKGISDDSMIIYENGIGAVLEDLDTTSYRLAVQQIEDILKLPRAENFKKIRAIAVQYRNFDNASRIYQRLYAE